MQTSFPAITGITDASNVRIALVQGTQIVSAPALGIGLQPLDEDLTAIAALAKTDGNIIVGNGTTWVAESGATARASLGLGSAATKELTSWVAYTPTFTGFGTVSGVSMWSRRVGDTLHIRGKFTSGTSTAVEARMTLGFNGVDGGVTSDATKVASIQYAGPATSTLAIAGAFNMLIESNVGYLTFGIENATAGGMTKRNGSAAAASGDTISIMAEVPISGW